MSVKLLTEHHLGFLCLKGSCTGSSETTLVKMPHCWKSHVTALLFIVSLNSVAIQLNIYAHLRLIAREFTYTYYVLCKYQNRLF